MIELDTLVVAILGALLGGLGATWLRIRHEQDEAFRDRQITAADDFSTGLQQALIALEQAWKACLEHGFYDAKQLEEADAAEKAGKHFEPPPPLIRDRTTREVLPAIKEALERAGEKIGEAQAREARIALLFGPYVPSPRAGTLALMMLDDALRALDGWPRPDLDGYREKAAGARKYLRSFNEQALKDIRGRPWYWRWRWVLWIRRRIRLLRKRRAERRAKSTERA